MVLLIELATLCRALRGEIPSSTQSDPLLNNGEFGRHGNGQFQEMGIVPAVDEIRCKSGPGDLPRGNDQCCTRRLRASEMASAVQEKSEYRGTWGNLGSVYSLNV